MFTMKDMLYFTMPNPAAFGEAGRMLVTDTAYDRNSHHVGTVVTIKDAGYTMRNGKAWRTTEDGTYVTGHCLNLTPRYRQDVVGTVDGNDSTFFYGSYREIDGGLLLATDVINSRAQYLIPEHQEGTYANQIHLNNWAPAAPWAHSLMPRAADSRGTIEAKLELAKAKWEMNRAVLEMAHEGYQRGWTDELKELHDNPDLDFLPRPRLGVLFTGQVLLPGGEDAIPLTPEQQAKVQILRGKSAAVASTFAPKIPVSVVLPLDLSINLEESDAVTVATAVTQKTRQVLQDPEITIGQHTLSYFANGLSSLV